MGAVSLLRPTFAKYANTVEGYILSDRWPKATKESPCPRCGKTNRCLIAPDSMAGVCWRSGSKEVWQANGENVSAASNGNYYDYMDNRAGKNGKPAKPDQYPTPRPTYQVRSFVNASDAIAAATPKYQGENGSWLTAEFANLWEYPETAEYPMVVARYNLPDGSKQFRPVHRAANGWRIGDPPGLLPLYKSDLLPETGQIFLLEGEKCCDLARDLDLSAVASAHGSNAAEKTDWAPLAGREVVVIRDNDTAGEVYAKQVSSILGKLSCRTKIINLPGVPPGGDIEQFDQSVGGSTEATREAIMQIVITTEWIEPPRPAGDPTLIFADSVVTSPIRWLWRGRIPLGRITIACGRPGCGKSFMTTDFAARVSTGTPWPDGELCDIGSALIISAEDDPEDTICPRLDSHMADRSKIALLNTVAWSDGTKQFERMFSLADVNSLDIALQRLPACRLVVIDPIGSFLGNGIDSHRDNDVRGVLAPIATIAKKRDVAVLMIAHTRKSLSQFADDGVLGSRAFTGIARMVWHLSENKDKKDQLLLLPGKNNLSKRNGGLSFEISGEPARLVWDAAPVDMSADDVAGDGAGGTSTAQDGMNEAMDWLRRTLLDGLPRSVNELKSEAVQAGLSASWRTIRRASAKLGLRSERSAFQGNYTWRMVL